MRNIPLNIWLFAFRDLYDQFRVSVIIIVRNLTQI